MRKTVALFILVCVFFTISAQSVPNGDFEQWTSDNIAVGWTTLFEIEGGIPCDQMNIIFSSGNEE